MSIPCKSFETNFSGKCGIVAVSCSRQNGFIVTNTRLQDNPYDLITRIRFNVAGIDVDSIKVENIDTNANMTIKIEGINALSRDRSVADVAEMPITCDSFINNDLRSYGRSTEQDFASLQVVRAKMFYDQLVGDSVYKASVKFIKSDCYDYQVRYDVKHHVLTLAIIQIAKIRDVEYAKMYGTPVKQSIKKTTVETEHKSKSSPSFQPTDYEKAVIDHLVRKYL